MEKSEARAGIGEPERKEVDKAAVFGSIYY